MPESKKISELTDSPAINIALDTLSIGKQALVFCSTKASAEATAEKISDLVKSENTELIQLSEKALHALSTPTKQCKRLSSILKKGIAFHHAGLASEQRKLIEDNFKAGTIKIICCTPTLCLSENTKIWHGMKETIVNKFSSKNPLFVLSNNNKLMCMKALKIDKNFNEKNLIRITSVSGYSITLTPNHEILVKRGTNKQTICASECQKSDKIATIGKISLKKTDNANFNDFVTENEISFDSNLLSTDVHYLIGAMLGDGYSGAEKIKNKIIYKGSPCIVGKDFEIFNSIIETCKNLNIHYNLSKNYYGTPSLVLTKASWFREFLCNCGVEKGIDKHINEKLLSANEECTKSLLQGLYDTDGYVQKGIKAVGFANTSIRLIKNVQKLLLRFCIVTMLLERKASTMKIYSKEYPTKKSYELLIVNKKSLQIFQKEINFKVERKKEALFNILKQIEDNINYFECKKCNYRIYHDLFSGRTESHKVWGKKKLKIINALGVYGELKSTHLTKVLGFLPRHKTGNRLNHHYQLISKKRYKNRDWIWYLNPIGKFFHKFLFQDKLEFASFFEFENCPICNKGFSKVIKKGWRDADFEGDIFWDKIKKIETVKKEDSESVYDVVLSNNRQNKHFFVAEGILVHNSFGLNLPAFRAIMKDLKRYGGRWGMQWIPTLEYHQCIGRAGRPDYNDKFGEAISVAQTETEKEEIKKRFVDGSPENIYSKLAVEPVLRTYVLSLVASGVCRSKEDLLSFFEKTFYGYQFRDENKIEAILSKIIQMLEEWEFVKTSVAASDFVSADEIIGQGKIDATIIGKRVSELYIDPYTANFLIACMKRAANKIANEFSILHMASNTLEMRPIFTARAKEIPEIEETLSKKNSIVLEPTYFDPEYDDFLSATKTAIVLEEWLNEKDEEYILENYNVRPGEFNVKKESADWVSYAAEELAILLEFRDVVKIIRKTRFRLRHGIKDELIPLVKLEGIGRVRARKLFRNGIKNIGDIRACDVAKLSQILGKAIALDVKKQSGEDIIKDVIPKNKRKGQINIEDF
ncbi:MAG: LAGLIDADG family homing endonuclease [archaeon]